MVSHGGFFGFLNSPPVIVKRKEFLDSCHYVVSYVCFHEGEMWLGPLVLFHSVFLVGSLGLGWLLRGGRFLSHVRLRYHCQMCFFVCFLGGMGCLGPFSILFGCLVVSFGCFRQVRLVAVGCFCGGWFI